MALEKKIPCKGKSSHSGEHMMERRAILTRERQEKSSRLGRGGDKGQIRVGLLLHRRVLKSCLHVENAWKGM